MTLSAWNTDEELHAAGYVVGDRYIDHRYGIDWAIILWRCPRCGLERECPGPGDPPWCSGVEMVPVQRRRPDEAVP